VEVFFELVARFIALAIAELLNMGELELSLGEVRDALRICGVTAQLAE